MGLIMDSSDNSEAPTNFSTDFLYERVLYLRDFWVSRAGAGYSDSEETEEIEADVLVQLSVDTKSSWSKTYYTWSGGGSGGLGLYGFRMDCVHFGIPVGYSLFVGV